MGYSARFGRRPPEFASKASHHHIIKDAAVQEYLTRCNLPPPAEAVSFAGCETADIDEAGPNPLKHVIAVDGGYTEVTVRPEFPSATIAFFQIGALIFGVEDLVALERSRFISPEQMSKLKNIERIKLAVPTKCITLRGSETLTHSIRCTLRDFFLREPRDRPLADTLRWFLFEEYMPTPQRAWTLARCPLCHEPGVSLLRDAVAPDLRVPCSACKRDLLLTDAFRLHEAIDDELGASGILGYLVTLLEQLILVHLVKIILDTKASLLDEAFFLKDGPLAFFGQTANMFKPMRRLVSHLQAQHRFVLVGAEKSGPFVEHADAIRDRLKPGQALLLSNEYIYRYIVPGEADPTRPYGATTYYGSKLIYKTVAGSIYVLTLPTDAPLPNPKASDFKYIDVALRNIARLRCDMYDSSLVPVALVNKLVSLADHPSTKIIERFARDSVSR